MPIPFFLSLLLSLQWPQIPLPWSIGVRSVPSSPTFCSNVLLKNKLVFCHANKRRNVWLANYLDFLLEAYLLGFLKSWSSNLFYLFDSSLDSIVLMCYVWSFKLWTAKVEKGEIKLIVKNHQELLYHP